MTRLSPESHPDSDHWSRSYVAISFPDSQPCWLWFSFAGHTFWSPGSLCWSLTGLKWGLGVGILKYAARVENKPWAHFFLGTWHMGGFPTAHSGPLFPSEIHSLPAPLRCPCPQPPTLASAFDFLITIKTRETLAHFQPHCILMIPASLLIFC